MKGKKILSISPYNFFLKENGVQNRIYALNYNLEKSNSITYFIRNEGNIPNDKRVFLIPNNKLSLIFNFKIFRSMLKESKNNDLILINTIWSGFYGILFKIFTRKKVIFDNHNVEYLRFKRTKDLKWILIFFYEFLTCHFSDKVVFVSEVDRDKAKKVFGLPLRKLIVMNNGFFQVSSKFQKIDFKKEFGLDIKGKHKVLFFGALDYQPNQEALGIIQREIQNRLDDDYVILVAGKSRQKYENSTKIKYLGFVDDITQVILNSDLVIVPLISGSGTRIKILETLGLNKTVVSTKIGAEGINLEITKNKLIVSEDRNWNQFVELIKKNIKNSSNISKKYYDEYEWSKIVENIEI